MSATAESPSGRTGIEDLRRLVMNFNYCRESFLERFTIAELVKLHHAHQGCAWDFFPDQWTERQVREALRGRIPTWDPATEKPTYDPPRPRGSYRARRPSVGGAR